MVKILVLDNIDPICSQTLGQNFHINVQNKKDKAHLLNIISEYHVLLVRSATNVDRELLDKGINLRMIGRAGTGVDNIDVPAASSNGIIVINTPNANTISAAEHTCGLILSLSRSIPQAVSSLKDDKWDRSKYLGSEISGKTLALIGLGRIGIEVAYRMKAFGMNVIGYDPMVSIEAAAQNGIEWRNLDQIWPIADYISVHTPLIPQTKNLLNRDVFLHCQKGFKVVNCARGGIINEEDLLWSLNEGLCGGAGLDVYTEEPPNFNDKSSPLYKLLHHPAVVCTPHLGASTVDAQQRVAVEIGTLINQLYQLDKSLFCLDHASSHPAIIHKSENDYTNGTTYDNQNGVRENEKEISHAEMLNALEGIVNGHSLRWHYKPQSKGWMKLAHDMGYVVGQVLQPIQRMDKICNSNLALHDTSLNFVIKGKDLIGFKQAIFDSFLTGLLVGEEERHYNIIKGPATIKKYPWFTKMLHLFVCDEDTDYTDGPESLMECVWKLSMNEDMTCNEEFNIKATLIASQSPIQKHSSHQNNNRFASANIAYLVEFCGIKLWPTLLLKFPHLHFGFLNMENIDVDNNGINDGMNNIQHGNMHCSKLSYRAISRKNVVKQGKTTLLMSKSNALDPGNITFMAYLDRLNAHMVYHGQNCQKLVNASAKAWKLMLVAENQSTDKKSAMSNGHDHLNGHRDPQVCNDNLMTTFSTSDNKKIFVF